MVRCMVLASPDGLVRVGSPETETETERRSLVTRGEEQEGMWLVACSRSVHVWATCYYPAPLSSWSWLSVAQPHQHSALEHVKTLKLQRSCNLLLQALKQVRDIICTCHLLEELSIVYYSTSWHIILTLESTSGVAFQFTPTTAPGAQSPKLPYS